VFTDVGLTPSSPPSPLSVTAAGATEDAGIDDTQLMPADDTLATLADVSVEDAVQQEQDNVISLLIDFQLIIKNVFVALSMIKTLVW